MKLLWILPYTPTSIRTRPYNLLQALIRAGHHLTLATVCEKPEERETLEKLSAQGVRVISAHLARPQMAINLGVAFWGGKPLQSRYSWSPRLAGRLINLLRNEQFDAVHVEHLRGSVYGLLAAKVLAGARQAERVVWDSVDCISLLFEQAARRSRSGFGRWVTRLELPRTRRYERELVKTFATALVTSENDKTGFERLAGHTLPQVKVLPNGVDTQYFCPDETARYPAEVIFSGKLSYHANVTAAIYLIQEVMPIVWASRPEVTVILAGKDPARDVVQLARRYDRVQVTGTVEDLRPYLRRATAAAALVPYGVGIQNKVLEAMACGTAVVGSPQAAAALQVLPGQDMLVAEGAQAQARALELILSDPDLRQRLGAGGRRYVERQHDWEKIAHQLEHYYLASNNTPGQESWKY